MKPLPLLLSAAATVFAAVFMVMSRPLPEQSFRTYGALTRNLASASSDLSEARWNPRPYSIPLAAVPTNTTIGELLATLNQARRRPSGEIEQLVDFQGYVKFIAERLVQNTRFEGKVQINAPPRPGFVNLYVLRDDPAGVVKQFKGTCTALTYAGAVLCDEEFIADYFKSFESVNTLYDVAPYDAPSDDPSGLHMSLTEHIPAIQHFMRQMFLVWIIGHEVAHVVQHHDDSGSQSDSVDYSALEREADAFVAHRVMIDVPLGVNFRVMLGEFIQQEYRRLYKAQHPQEGKALTVSEDRLIPFERPLTLPAVTPVPLLLRALRLLNTLDESFPDAKDRAYYVLYGGTFMMIDTLSPGEPYKQIAQNTGLRAVSRSRMTRPIVMALAATLLLCSVAVVTYTLRRIHPEATQ